MNASRTNILAASVIFGSLWGLAEAVLGHLLHLASRATLIPGLAGLVMFPIGFLCLREAFRRSGSVGAIGLTAGITASIKMASLVLPTVSLEFVVNPTLAILAEGAAVAVFFLIAPTVRVERPLVKASALSLSWRAVFLLVVLLLPVPRGLLNKGWEVLVWFLLVESAANALLIAALLRLRVSQGTPSLTPGRLPAGLLPVLLLVTAVAVTGLLTMAAA